MTERLLESFLRQNGDRTAIVNLDGATWSFDQVLGRALSVAQQLRARGDIAGRVVLLRTGPDALFSVADLAVLLAGGVPAVVPDLTSAQLESVWQVVDPIAVIDTTGRAEEPLTGMALRHRAAVHRIDEPGCRPGGTPAQWRAVARRWAGTRLEQTAAVVFTSGTTGTPRAVALSEAALVRGVHAWTRQWAAPPARTMSYLPVSHVAQRIMGHTLMCLHGTTLVISTPDRITGDVAAHRPDTLLGVPQIFARLAEASRDNETGRGLRSALGAMATAVNGGAALDRGVAAELRTRTGLRIVGAYGMTETTAPAFHQSDASRPGLGRPLDIEHRITGEGELQVRGRNLAAGYVQRWPLLRPVTGRDGWLSTGDLARILGDGEVQLAGRLASAFKTSRGEVICPEPVEAHLLAHPVVTAACLLGHGLPRAVALVCAPATATWPPGHVTALENELLAAAETARRRGEIPWSDLHTVRVVPDSWDALGLVTSTGKPRRRDITNHYHPLLPTSQELAHAPV
ncbi:AMP-binding protein [Streptomyces anulatus]|uniref:AMP-binding protein n=1 Tax=Streptomyces anulatus TaxID=1892 RepID=UPI001C26DB18|nr:AMP-binding protein [Streptomyces anulatus]